MTGVEQYVLKDNVPWTLHGNKPDHAYMKPDAECQPIANLKPDGKLTFNRLNRMFISNPNHEKQQPARLDASVSVKINLIKHAGYEVDYGPAGVYELVKSAGNTDRLQINARHCTHCKTGDIKDSIQNFVWVMPESSGGPNYAEMQ